MSSLQNLRVCKTKEIEDILICPICQNLASIPVYQCSNGHLICFGCVEKVKHCPVCRILLPANKIRNLVVEQIAEKLSVDCKHIKDGCDFKGKLSEYNQHLTRDCHFESMNICELLGSHDCKMNTSLSDIAAHVAEKHTLLPLHTDTRQSHFSSDSTTEKNSTKKVWGLLKQQILSNLLSDTSYAWEPIYTCYYGVILAIRSMYDANTKTLVWDVVSLGSLFAQTTYDVCFLFTAKTGAKFKWISKPISLKHLKSKNISQFKVPVSYIFENNIQNNGSTIKWILEICIRKEKKKFERTFSSNEDCYISANCHPVANPINELSTRIGTLTDGSSTVQDYVHTYVTCDNCGTHPIKGIRYKCAHCQNFDLCELCEKNQVHSHHLMIRCVRPSMKSQLNQYFIS